MTYNSSKTGAQVDNAVTDVENAKAASATDTTAGRLLKVGDFGVGGVTPVYSASLNDLVDSGFYFTGSAVTNGPGWTEGQLLNLVRLGSPYIGAQVAFDRYNDKAAFRRASGSGTWSPWRELLHTGNTPIQPNATNLILDSGARLGIGTGPPDQPLHVLGGFPTVKIERDTGAGGAASLNFTNSTNAGRYITGSDTTMTFGYAPNIDSATGLVEHLRIDSSGNVGIGTAGGSVLGKLHVKGTSSAFLRIDGAVGTSFFGQASDLISGGSTSDSAVRYTNQLQFSRGGVSPAMTLDSSGNLLVGLTSAGTYTPNTTTERTVVQGGVKSSGGFYTQRGTVLSLGAGVPANFFTTIPYGNYRVAARLNNSTGSHDIVEVYVDGAGGVNVSRVGGNRTMITSNGANTLAIDDSSGQIVHYTVTSFGRLS